MKKGVCFWCIICCINFSICDQEASSYKGSQAYNSGYKASMSVNQATGTFHFSYPLISAPGTYQAFHFNIEYRRNQKPLFGLPKGWRFNLDYIDGKTANINNQQWLVDPLWHDEQGFGSGLRYFNLHSTRFFDAGFVQTVPEKTDLKYRYRLTLKDGTKKYFSHEGWLIFIVDRFGNALEFHYLPIADNLSTSRLDWIKDEYGNKYHFQYAPQSLSIQMPDNRKTTLYFNNNGITEITNPINQSIHIHYQEQLGQTLIENIETSKGLITSLNYSTIDIKQKGKTVKLPVIDQITKSDKHNYTLLEQIFYEHSLDNNFTGFPKYSLSDEADNLIESNDQSYRYSVTVKRNQLIPNCSSFHVQTYYYNYLHLPVDVITYLENLPLTKTSFEYDISPFRYSRSTNYDKPRATTNRVWINHQQQWMPSDRKTNSYDWFGNKTAEKHEVFDRNTKQWVAIYSQEATFDNHYFGLPKYKVTTDAINQQAVQTTYTFTEDHKAHQTKKLEFKRNKADSWQPWKVFKLQYDAKGRKIHETMHWTDSTNSFPSSTSLNTIYEEDTANKRLKMIQTSALGHKHQLIFDTRTGFLISSISPKNETTDYRYDAIGRVVQVIDSLGVRTSTQYEDFADDGNNSTVVTSPLGYSKRTLYDALERTIENQDTHDKKWRMLEKFTYDGLGNRTSETNRLGVSIIRRYDTQNRLIKETDAWGNRKTIKYNDNDLNTDFYLNDHKLFTTESLPWKNSIIQRYFPLRNEDDTSGQAALLPLEKTISKNGFGQVYFNQLALVNEDGNTRKIVSTKTCEFDAEHNPSICQSHGKDGLKLIEKNTFDLFNNRIQTSKIQTLDGKTTESHSLKLRYSKDNRLETLTYPGEKEPLKQYLYDGNGNINCINLNNAHSIHFEYDVRNQQIQKSWQRLGKPFWVKQRFDTEGRIKKQWASDETYIIYDYIASGLVKSMHYSDGKALGFQYDDFDRLVSYDNNEGQLQQNIYHRQDNGKLSEIHLSHNNFQMAYGNDSYRLKGRLVKQQFNTLTNGQSETDFHYGPTGKVNQTKSTYHEPKISYDVNYQHNMLGQLTKLTSSTARKKTHEHKKEQIHSTIKSYSYDAFDRLTKEENITDKKTTTYHYDANNNLVNETTHSPDVSASIDYQYNAFDHLLSQSHNNQTTTLQYDHQGRLIQTSKGDKYTYDDSGYLLTLKNNKGEETEYSYWSNGLLSTLTHQLNGTVKDTSHFYYDNNHQLLEQTTENTSINYLHDKKKIIASAYHDVIAHWFLSSDNTGLTIDRGEINSFEYEPYGLIEKKAPASQSILGWKQHYFDQQSQLTTLNHRFYSPELKRFITPDEHLNANLYTFGNANPVMYDDPHGLDAQRYVNYAIGTSSVAFGLYATYESIVMAIVGAILAVPTGGASLSLSAGAAVVASVASSASGIALLGSQASMDTGHPEAANALNYTSIAFSAVHVVTGLIALAPKAEDLLSRAGKFFAKRGGIANLHPEADASTIYHIGSDLEEGEKDVAKIISGWDVLRHGLHVTTKVTTDSFNISKALQRGKPPTYSATFGGNDRERNNLTQQLHAQTNASAGKPTESTVWRFPKYLNWHSKILSTNPQNSLDKDLVNDFFIYKKNCDFYLD
jgi:RHS repeat-associated protein